MEQQPAPAANTPKINTKILPNGVIEVTGNFQLMLEKRKEILRLFGLPEDTRFETLQFKSLVPKTAFYKKALTYLNLCLDVPQDNFDPETITDFHADWIRKNLTAPKVEEFTQFPVCIPLLQASLLIEAFCSNQPEQFQFMFQKRFLYNKTILNINLLAPLPMAFQFDQKTQGVIVTFANTPTITAQQIHRQFMLSNNLFNTVKSIQVSFQQICPEHFNTKSFKELSNKLECIFTVCQRESNPSSKEELIDFDMCIVPSKPGKEFRDEVTAKLTEYYHQYYEAKYCPRCRRYYPLLSNSDETCGVYEHTGEQIPFPDGKMEHVEHTLDGDLTTVYYTCCGEIDIKSKPVEYMEFDAVHLPDESGKTYSSITFNTF